MSEPIRCAICGEFKNISEFGKKRASTELNPYCRPCGTGDLCCKRNGCTYKAKKPIDLTRHTKGVHDKIKDQACSECELKFTLKSDLNDHIKAVHLKEKNFKCTLCDYVGIKQSIINVHYSLVHAKERTVKCEQCDSTFSVKTSLKAHIKAVHDKIKDVKCEQCDYVTSHVSSLNLHVKHVHNGIREHACDKCGYKFRSKNHLERHSAGCIGSERISTGENAVKIALELMNIQFEREKRFPDCKHKYTLPFDFYLPSLNALIEFDGQGHFHPIERFGGQEALDDVRLRDSIKNEYCASKSIPLLRIKYTEYNQTEKLVEEFVSKLSLTEANGIE
jgi:hypothetical protein